jgi:retron-type reverse transcriptase
MKRHNNLFEKIVSLDNIILAHSHARKGKTSRSDVRKVDNDVIGYCTKIQKMLVDETYRTSDYFLFNIHEPKERVIYRLPYYPDRIIHHAIMNILEPIWVGLMINNTYSCIKKRGIHKVLQDVQRDLHHDPAGTEYCLKLDIRKFYPSIDHEILKQIVRRKIKDVRLLRLLDHIIDSADGVPIGNYLSQFFANLYLTYFDHFVQEELGFKYYYRYADDIVILSDSKEKLHKLYKIIDEYLTTKLKLRVKGNYQVFPVEARSVNFVGYQIYHQFTLVRENIKRHFCKVNSKLKKWTVSFKKYRRKLASFVGWFGFADANCLLKGKVLYKQLLVYLMKQKRAATK